MLNFVSPTFALAGNRLITDAFTVWFAESLQVELADTNTSMISFAEPSLMRVSHLLRNHPACLEQMASVQTVLPRYLGLPLKV